VTGRAEDSLPSAISALASEVGPDEAARRLSQIEFRPVLTAHPTEARRRAVASAIRRISVLLAERDDSRLGESALAENRRRLLEEIDGLWRTAQLRTHKPSPLDEVRTALGIFDEVLFDVLPVIYRRLDNWLLGENAGRPPCRCSRCTAMGSWSSSRPPRRSSSSVRRPRPRRAPTGGPGVRSRP
jgi:phosphoenolpyruvate carboxylase